MFERDKDGFILLPFVDCSMKVRYDENKAITLGHEYKDLTHGKIYETEGLQLWPDDDGTGNTLRFMLVEDDRNEQEPYDVRIFNEIVHE